jgi:hypothetical protein
LSEDISPLQAFYRHWGYLPPLDEEAIAVINAIITNPDTANDYRRIGPGNEDFFDGLKYRNVNFKESTASDLYMDHIKLLKYEKPIETDKEKEVHGRL